MNPTRFFCRIIPAVFLLIFAANAQAEMAPDGKYLPALYQARPLLYHPVGKYKTRLGWLLSSIVRYDNRSPFDIWGSFANPAYLPAYNAEVKYIQSLSGARAYRYNIALLRDLAKVEIQHLQGERTKLVFTTAAHSMIADAAAAGLTAGFKKMISKERETALDLAYASANYPNNEIRTATRYAFFDIQMRYHEVLDKRVLDQIERQLSTNVDLSTATSLISESMISTAFGTWLKNHSASSEQFLAEYRRQIAMDIAAWHCACALDPNIFAPPQAWHLIYNGKKTYRTKLGYLLALKLAPPSPTITNILSGNTANGLLKQELQFLVKLKETDHVRYISYLRSFLPDMEELEAEQLRALRGGVIEGVLRDTGKNLLFGSIAAGGGLPFQAAVILVHAGYEGLAANQSVSDEIKLRMENAALREIILNQLLSGDICGCGVGVVVTPRRVIKGKSVK
jgi:hypothetical protein